MDSSSTTSVTESPNFRCEIRPEGPATVRVIATGELDLATAPILEEELSTITADVKVVILDLRQLAFVDSTGLSTIIQLDARLREQDRELALIRGPSQIQRLFLLTGVESRLNFVAPPEA